MGRTKLTPDWDIEMNETQLLKRYTALHDGLSNMIEGGRLTHEMIPDDYDWLLLTLLGAMDIAATEKKTKEGLYSLSDFQIFTIIEGLRCLQRNGGPNETPLDDIEIDTLCEELNC